MFIILLSLSGLTLSYCGLHPLFSALGKVKENFFIVLTSNIIYVLVALLLVKLIGVYGVVFATATQYILTIVIKEYITKQTIKNGEELKILPIEN